MDDFPLKLVDFPALLDRGGAARALPRFDGTPEWYMRNASGSDPEGDDAWLVSMFSFTASWDSWEVHPNGHELVLCLDGEADVTQEIDGAQSGMHITKGEWFANPPGAWHTMDLPAGGSCTCLFITSGRGTENRAR